MVKGSHLQVVRLQKPNSRYFEEVLFVLRDGCDRGAECADVVAEATRILEENAQERERGKRGQGGRLPAFFLGFVLALGVCLPIILGHMT